MISHPVHPKRHAKLSELFKLSSAWLTPAHYGRGNEPEAVLSHPPIKEEERERERGRGETEREREREKSNNRRCALLQIRSNSVSFGVGVPVET